MKQEVLLRKSKTASLCEARWGHMVGNDRVRCCGQCRRFVYNFSGLTEEEAAQLVHATEGKANPRYFERADGTLLTEDCPVGASRFWGRVRRLLVSTLLLVNFIR